ncbi:hypothetical protein [Streptomyces sp. bgisy022]|uniref:hypothetical protein n=1 Tax=Streptomyces sp. bgisy022 TaxID=3413769 RepID=UPI003D753F6D
MTGSHTPEVAKGSMGHGYARHSRVQHSAADHGMPLLRRALDSAVLPRDGSPFRVADLGAAAGTNSLAPLRAVVEGVRARTGARTPVTVVHTDIPANDFNALFDTLTGSPDSYVREPDVYACAEARSFYEPLFPTAELHLAWSAIAVHWLSRVPGPVLGHVFSSRATGVAREALRQQSRQDWEAFLTHRARELRSGGQLVVLGGASAEDGTSGAEGLMDAADAVLGDLAREGLITTAEHARMTIPTWNRTAEEFLAPLGADPLAEVLRLEEHELVALPDPHLERYEETGDASAFAEGVTQFFRAAFEPSLFSALDPERSDAEVSAAAGAFAEGLRARAAADPKAVETHWHVLLLRVTRR